MKLAVAEIAHALRSAATLEGVATGYSVDSDNPQSEDPRAIINDALVGLRRFDTPHIIELDREKAIGMAIERAAPGDVVLIAGKGHEPYQTLRERTIDFDDREVAREVLRGFGYRK